MVYHYVYDKNKNTLTKTSENASDPNNQWVFCTEDHFKKRKRKNSFECIQCQKKQNAAIEPYWYNTKKNDGLKFCSENCLNVCYAPICLDCQQKCLETYYEFEAGCLCSACRNKRIKEFQKVQQAEKGDLVVDPCAGGFGILTICQATKKNFLGTDLNYYKIKEFMQQAKNKAKGKSYWGEKVE